MGIKKFVKNWIAALSFILCMAGLPAVKANASVSDILYRDYIKSYSLSLNIRANGEEHNPQGYLDRISCNANDTITVEGWAYDKDDPGAALDIHVYVGGSAGSSTASLYVVKANLYRPDVDCVYLGAGSYHGFASTINVDKTGPQSIYVYAINVGAGGNTFIGDKVVSIKSSNPVNSTARPIADGMYKLVSAINSRYVWDICDASFLDGANLQLYQDNGTNAQKFVFTYNKDGYYIIKNVNSGKAIDCTGAAFADGTNVQQYTLNNSDAQQWKLTEVGNGYISITCRCNGKVVDVAGANAVNGTNIQMYQPNGSTAQKFRFVETTANQESSNSGNTVSAQRMAVVNYMNAMAMIQWTPAKSFQHWSYGQKNGNDNIWTRGVTYYGIPYSQNTRETNLEKFKKNISGGVYVGPAKKNSYLGSDCSSAVSMAYQVVNAGFPMSSTLDMYPVDGNTRRVGNYNHYNSRSSSTICSRNGRNAMKNSYRNLQVGDLLLSSSQKHVMMVTGVEDNYVKVTHQTAYSKDYHSSWRVNEQRSFDLLYNEKYIPVTMAAW